MFLIELLKKLVMSHSSMMIQPEPVPAMPMKKRKIAVIGAGSAGVLTTVHFCTWLNTDWEVYCIYNPKRPILGIGESTNGEFVGLLEKGLRFGIGNEEDLKALDATLKFGSKFANWRKQSWINPLLDGNIAIHFNNFKFKEFAFDRLAKLWPKQFRLLEGDVQGMLNHDDRVVVTIDGVEHDFDFVVDCMGTPQDFTDYTMSECSPVNRCQIHSITEFEYNAYTDHIATKNGWMFGVPLQSRKTFGYLYNDKITTQEEAIADMKEILGVDEIENKEYKLKCYYANKLVEGRICKNGNKALFFEPLVANSIFIYLYSNRCIYDYIMGNVSAADTNSLFVYAVQSMEDVISYYYQGGSIFDSKFWDFAIKHTRERLLNRPNFQKTMTMYRSLKEQGVLHTAPVYGLKPLTWEIVDEQTGYGYLDGVGTEMHSMVSETMTMKSAEDILDMELYFGEGDIVQQPA